MALLVILSNSGGELDRRVVETEEETRAAALDIIAGVAWLSEGDTLRVVAKED